MIKAGFDIGGSSVKAAVLKNGSVEKLKIPSFKNSFLKTLKLICGYIEKNKIQAASFACPGPINTQKGVIYTMPNFKGVKNFNLHGYIKKNTPLKNIKLINDANAFVLGEYEYLKDEYNNVIGFTVGTGIGGGIIINKKLYTGGGSLAGEFGHIIIQKDGRKCGCGNNGCFEAYAGEAHFFKNIKKFKNFYELYKSNTSYAKQIIEKHTDYLACGISSIINILSPEAVIIGGAVTKSYRVFGAKLKTKIKPLVFNKKVKIFKARRGEYAGALGALFYNGARVQVLELLNFK